MKINLDDFKIQRLIRSTVPTDSMGKKNYITTDENCRSDRFNLVIPIPGTLNMERNKKWVMFLTYVDPNLELAEFLDAYLWNSEFNSVQEGYIPYVRSRKLRLHRIIMDWHRSKVGLPPLSSNEVVHHVNHIRYDNRISNLEVMTKDEHDKQRNRRKS